MEDTKKTSGRRFTIAAVALLFIVNCGTFYFLYSTSVSKSELAAQKTLLQNNFKRLSDTLDVRNMEIERLQLARNEEFNNNILINKSEIEGDKIQIADFLAREKLTLSDLRKAKKMIAKYQMAIDSVAVQINEMTAKNLDLNSQNQMLAADLSAERQTSSHLSEQNKGLTKKIENGSLLELIHIDVAAIRKKSNGSEIAVNKAKSAQQLRISFETGGNKVLDPGPMSLYVRIINPKGETIAVAEEGSGLIPTLGSQLVQYTKKADIDWDQKNKKVIVYWARNISDAGTYKVQVYQKGYVVGEGKLDLI